MKALTLKPNMILEARHNISFCYQDHIIFPMRGSREAAILKSEKNISANDQN